VANVVELVVGIVIEVFVAVLQTLRTVTLTLQRDSTAPTWYLSGAGLTAGFLAHLKMP
jgi:hypothetical protein